LEKLNIEIVQQGQLTNVTIESTIKDQIISAQIKNSSIAYIKEKFSSGQQTNFSIDDTDVLWFKNRLVVPKVPELRQLILDEAHNTRFSIHPGSNKMYQDLKQRFWLTKMKIEIAKYVARCDTCRRVKVVHLKSAGMLQPLPIPSWKWEDISMDFITGLPKTSRGFDLIWVIVDRLTKSAHFIPVKIEHSTRPLCLIEVRSLLTISRGTYMSPWLPNFCTVPLIIHKQVARPKGSIKFLKIC
jgi:hypothetical protein